MRSCSVHLGTRFDAGPDSKLARTLLLLGDAEIAAESAQENRSGVARYFVNI
jgi:hypothetical protein